MPSIIPYSVSKMAVAAYTDGLRAELSQWGIKVCMLEPGFFKTPQANPQASMDDAARFASILCCLIRVTIKTLECGKELHNPSRMSTETSISNGRKTKSHNI